MRLIICDAFYIPLFPESFKVSSAKPDFPPQPGVLDLPLAFEENKNLKQALSSRSHVLKRNTNSS